MALFYSLSPPLGSRSNRNAAELLCVELSLLMPQDRFLPAREIQAQVWTNIIYQHNPDGPAVWREIPMSFSHVENLPKNQPLPAHLANEVASNGQSKDAPEHCIAVFRTHLIPTGRGDFGLTCRWKSHRDQQEWQWATRNESENGEISVRIPRNYASTSSWTLGPQSVLIMTKNGLRTPGVTPSNGPGLYLGNHGAASKAKLSGYDAVLSLVSDILDFDETIPDPDTSSSKNLWDPVKHQKQVQEMKQQLKEFAQRQEEYETMSNGDKTHSRSTSSSAFTFDSFSRSPSYLGLSRRSSVSDMGVHLKSNGEHKVAAEDEDDGPRLSRKTSVTELIVKPTSGKRLQSKSSTHSIRNTDLDLQEKPNEENEEETPLSRTGPASKTGTETKQQQQQQQQQQGSKATPAGAKKNKHNRSISSVQKGDTAAATSESPASAALSKGTNKAGKATQAVSTIEGQGSVTSPIVKSLEVGSTTQEAASKTAAVQPHEAGDSNDKTGLDDKKSTVQEPPSSGRVLSTIADHAQESNAQYRSRLSSSSTMAALTALKETTESDEKRSNGSATGKISNDVASNGDGATATTKPKKPFSHKVITLSPGAHRPIGDKDLKEAIEFLAKELAQDKKVLVHCRDGNGRSGSVVLAYMVAKCQHPHRITYDDALREVWKWKCDVYPHQGLRQSIEKHADTWRDL
ncbi:hypothetical protein BGW41_001721 [Actinomortierella wolfii]|nr:hypothetical protein BGW41_001721 [Actinomortierella wolfii]